VLTCVFISLNSPIIIQSPNATDPQTHTTHKNENHSILYQQCITSLSWFCHLQNPVSMNTTKTEMVDHWYHPPLHTTTHINLRLSVILSRPHTIAPSSCNTTHIRTTTALPLPSLIWGIRLSNIIFPTAMSFSSNPQNHASQAKNPWTTHET
jgi:hypothetical protein